MNMVQVIFTLIFIIIAISMVEIGLDTFKNILEINLRDVDRHVDFKLYMSRTHTIHVLETIIKVLNIIIYVVSAIVLVLTLKEVLPFDTDI